ncbi:MAG: hypothetical protein P8126_04835 [Gammaproteobacteria bacterium]|jgi:hypothetical protein
MEKLDATWKRAIKVWWALLWRGILFTLLITFPIGIVIGVIGAIMGEAEHVRIYSRLAGMILGIPIGIWVVKIVLNKQFSDFQIVLLPSNRSILDQAAIQAEQHPAGAEAGGIRGSWPRSSNDK